MGIWYESVYVLHVGLEMPEKAVHICAKAFQELSDEFIRIDIRYRYYQVLTPSIIGLTYIPMLDLS